MTAGVSGIVYAKNEAARIGQVIDSLAQVADEVVVADMASTDGTADVARAHGARVVPVPDFGYVEPARPIAMDACRFEWIVNLDADEVLPAPLVRRIREIVERDEVDVVRTSRLTWMIGSPVRWAGWGPQSDRLLRVWRRGSLHLPARIHESPSPVDGARIEELPVEDDLSIWHFNYTGWDHFLEKLNRYTTVEAREHVDSGRPAATRRALARTLGREFVDRYVHQRGFRDGYRGFVLSALMVAYRLSVDAKIRQFQSMGDSAQVFDAYRRTAAEAVAASRPEPV